MAVYTDIREDELENFLAAYDVGRLLSYRGIAEGVENSNFMLHTERGNFILTLYEKRVNEEDLPFFLTLMQHLAKKGIACPQPVERGDGALVGRLAGRPAALITFLEGMWMRRPDVEHCAGVGEALACLHLAGADFPMRRPNNLSLSGWQGLWEDVRPQVNGISAGLDEKIEEELNFLDAHWPQQLPDGVIHADLFPDNVFFLDDKLSGVIDFYFACTDAFAYDLAICLNAWCFEKDLSYNLTKGAALLSAYCGVRNLNQQEAAALPILARGAAMRFFMTRAYDWFHIPDGGFVVKKDPMEYLRKLQFFSKIVRASELGLSVD